MQLRTVLVSAPQARRWVTRWMMREQGEWLHRWRFLCALIAFLWQGKIESPTGWAPTRVEHHIFVGDHLVSDRKPPSPRNHIAHRVGLQAQGSALCGSSPCERPETTITAKSHRPQGGSTGAGFRSLLELTL